ncbi:MAG: bifunctional oligoribonuclease/PAP phosphatase NrnA [Clostridia bacterium]|nr:bifunctional oligoribonuclease/PAP phosphatase NrnA [Clostridia bacterium]
MRYTTTKKNRVDTKLSADIIQSANNVALFCHTRPDADTICSATALALALISMGKTATIFCDGETDWRIDTFLPVDTPIHNQFFGSYDLLISVDSGDVYRLGEFSGIFDNHSNTLCIDHHRTTPFAVNNLIMDLSSTAELIYLILEQLNLPLSDKIATQLYIGLSTDTGNFSYRNTSQHSFLIASKLLVNNIDIGEINRVFFREVSLQRTRMIGRMLSRMRTYYDGKMCLVYVDKQDLQFFGCDMQDTTEIVNYAINVKGCIVGVSLAEWAQNVYKISIRGNNYLVRDIAEYFGGGGHDMASGCQISGLFEDVVDKLVKAVGDKLL